MTATTPVIIVTGFLGAGKTALTEHLVGKLGTDPIDILEVNGLTTAAKKISDISNDPTRRVHSVIALADAANLPGMIEDHIAGPLIAAQIASADAVVITRSDVTEATPTQEAIAKLTDGPVIIAPHAQIAPADLPQHADTSVPDIDLTPEFETWDYTGPATLQSDQAEALLERRPKGVYRIAGQVKTDQGGLDLQLIGRARQITKIDRPTETRLHALGPKANFRRFEMDSVFSTYAAASAHLSGLLGHR